MDTKKPEPSDFGVTPKEYRLYTGKGNNEESLGPIGISLFVVAVSAIVAVAFVGILNASDDWKLALWLGLMCGLAAIFPPLGFVTMFLVGIVAWIIESTITRYKRNRILESPVASRIKLYEQAEATYRAAQEEADRQLREAKRRKEETERQRRESERQQQRRREQYWMSPGGIEFEQELASLSRAMGYHVESTPVSGDQGIDLVLKRNGKTTIVQCKAYKSPAGPAVARELFGSMIAYGADDAILACTGGFTKGVEEFVQGKPIRLISAPHLVRLAEQYGNKTQEITESPPTCPGQECGRPMVLRTGRYGSFWGCSAYPGCRGTRPV